MSLRHTFTMNLYIFTFYNYSRFASILFCICFSFFPLLNCVTYLLIIRFSFASLLQFVCNISYPFSFILFYFQYLLNIFLLHNLITITTCEITTRYVNIFYVCHYITYILDVLHICTVLLIVLFTCKYLFFYKYFSFAILISFKSFSYFCYFYNVFIAINYIHTNILFDTFIFYINRMYLNWLYQKNSVYLMVKIVDSFCLLLIRQEETRIFKDQLNQQKFIFFFDGEKNQIFAKCELRT